MEYHGSRYAETDISKSPTSSCRVKVPVLARLLIKVYGVMVLKAELHSRKSSLT